MNSQRDWLKGIPLNAFRTLLACLWEFTAVWNFFWKQSVDELSKFDTDVDCRHTKVHDPEICNCANTFVLTGSQLFPWMSPLALKSSFLIVLLLFYYYLCIFFLTVYMYNLYWHPVRLAFPKRSSDHLKNIPEIQLVTLLQLPNNNLVLLMCPRQHAKERFEKLQGCVTHDLDQYMERQVGKCSFFVRFLRKNVRNICKIPVLIAYNLKWYLQLSCLVLSTSPLSTLLGYSVWYQILTISVIWLTLTADYFCQRAIWLLGSELQIWLAQEKWKADQRSVWKCWIQTGSCVTKWWSNVSFLRQGVFFVDYALGFDSQAVYKQGELVEA